MAYINVFKIRINLSNGEIEPIDKFTDRRVNNFITEYNLKCDKTTNTKTLNAKIAWHDRLTLLESANFGSKYFFAQEHLEYDESRTNIEPIIHVTPFDIWSKTLSCDDNTIMNFAARYTKIIDSSICNFYTPIEPSVDVTLCITRLKNIIDSIIEHYNNNRYALHIVAEQSDYYARVIKESYLEGSAHSSYVSPFVFHSEQETCALLNKELVETKILDDTGKLEVDSNKVAFKSKFRILLLDDHANVSMRTAGAGKESDRYEYKIDESTKLCDHGKLKIIIDNIHSIFPNVNIAWGVPSPDDINNCNNNPICSIWNYTNSESTDFSIAIVCVRSVEDAKIALKHSRFDLVLLDYLLDTNKEKGGREYSYELLRYIYEHRSEKEYVNVKNLNGIEEKVPNEKYIPAGPLSKFYFMHISAFSTAIAERLQEQGLVYSAKYWHIGRGACPTNTPNLFLFYFFKLMEKRYSEMLFDEDYKIEGNTLIDLLKAIFKDNNSHVKTYSSSNFNALLNLRSKYDKMKYDTYPEEFYSKKDITAEKILNRRGSLLVYSLFPDIQHYSNSFWEHIQHLIYLFANGTMRQWPEMYEEYIFVRERLIAAENTLEIPTKEERPSYLIEQYIIQLKNA